MTFSAYKDISVLVTGGAGFIGSHLVRGLLAAGARVRVLDNLVGGSEANLTEVASRIDFIRGDITDLGQCRDASAGAQIVFHLAALGSVPGSVADPIRYNTVNINGTLNILEAARLEKVNRVVYSASSSAYGESPTLPKHEGMKAAPKSPYAVGKYTGELYADVYAQVYGLATISLRYFNVFGARQNPRSAYAAVIPAFITAVLENRRPQIYGDGGQTRDFCHVSNVVHANMLSGICATTPSGQVMNIACGQNISLNELLRKISAELGQSVTADYLPPRAGDVRDSLADITLAHELIGYQPVLYFDQGLKQTVDWYRQAFKK
jgi:nucleoside-diphosphate-sugar epimerase